MSEREAYADTRLIGMTVREHHREERHRAKGEPGPDAANPSAPGPSASISNKSRSSAATAMAARSISIWKRNDAMPQHGRDRDEEFDRSGNMTSGQGNAARQAPGRGMAGGRRGFDTESVEFDDMGDLDRGADNTVEVEPATGPGPGYGIFIDEITGDKGDRFDAASDAASAGPTGSGRGPVSAMRVDEPTGWMGSVAGDRDGIGDETDTDAEAIRGDSPSTGMRQRTGLGRSTCGSKTDLDPQAGVPFANPADMESQG